VCLRDSLRIDFTTQKVCFGQPAAFKASYQPFTDSVASYTWNFNDGSKEITTYHDTISHVFPQPGVYNVALSAVDTNGCSVTIIHQAVVDSLPVPNFTFVTPGCDQPTYFKDSSQGGGNFISTWRWNFGDISSGADNYSDLTNPSHIFISKDSLYQVKMVITNFNGCVDSITKPVIRYSCLKVLYTVGTGTGCANNPIPFVDRSVLHAASGNITQWKWDFGDGISETYSLYRDSIIHKFNAEGSYLVTLTVTADVNGRPFSKRYDSTIVITLPPIANFTVSNACTGQTVYFMDSTQTFGSNLVGWQWGFGDPSSSQNSSSLQNPEHVFEAVGNYQVQMVVSDDKNCRDTATRPVVVHPTPHASFVPAFNYNGLAGQVLMNNTSTGADSYLWNFGDGYTTTEKNPLYRYASQDTFHIMLIATSQYLCSDTATTVYDLTSGLYVPNSFAPESDVKGVNVFLPKGIHLKEYDVKIFSTWGTLLWESNKLTSDGKPAEGWDGTYKGKLMPAGNYVWRIKAKFLDNTYWQGSDSGDGNVKSYGTVTLIR
jgi:gliding motility-associated-like protein